MLRPFRSLLQPITAIFPHLSLILRLTRREFEARFRGTLLGPAWPILTPLAMMLVYTFVFQSVLAARWPGYPASDGSAYALNLLAGLVVFNLVADVLGRASRLILENPSYVKKVVFPLEVLPVVAVAGATLNALIGGAVLVLLHALLAGPPHAALLLAPLFLVPLLLWCLGICYLLAAIGVFLRDIGQVMGPVVMALLFLSPVFYAVEMVPAPWRDWLAASPVTMSIEWVRSTVLRGQWPDMAPLLWQTLAGMGVLWAGYYTFSRLRRGFADVL